MDRPPVSARCISAPGLFVMPNPWDAGTAKLLADLGFEAIATSSAALAWTLARPDATGAVTRDDAIAHARLLAEATRASRQRRFRERLRRQPGRGGRDDPPRDRRRRRRLLDRGSGPDGRRPLSARRGAPALLRREGGGDPLRRRFRADRPLRGVLPKASRSARRGGAAAPGLRGGRRRRGLCARPDDARRRSAPSSRR